MSHWNHNIEVYDELNKKGIAHRLMLDAGISDIAAYKVADFFYYPAEDVQLQAVKNALLGYANREILAEEAEFWASKIDAAKDSL